MKLLSSMSLVIIALAFCPATALAQSDQSQAGQAGSDNQMKANMQMPAANQANSSTDIKLLSEWQYAPLYESKNIRAEHLLNIEIFGPDGEEIGNVEDVIISGGQIAAVVAEVGGFWGIGDVHISIPWNNVTLVPDGIKIPVTEGNFEQYALYHETSYVNQGYLDGVITGVGAFGVAGPAGRVTGARCAQAGSGNKDDGGNQGSSNQGSVEPGDNGLVRGACAWRLTALVDDYVVLPDGTGYGFLEDVIFSRNGKIQAIVVESTLPGYGYGVYAYPFYGYGAGWAWNPYRPVYMLPYGADAIGALNPFEYEQFNGYWY